MWKLYRTTRIVFAAINDVFDPLLMLFHVTNVLRYAFLMERIIFPDEATAFTYIHLLYDIGKSEAIYLTATSISQQVKQICKFIKFYRVRFRTSLPFRIRRFESGSETGV